MYQATIIVLQRVEIKQLGYTLQRDLILEFPASDRQ